MSIVFACIPEMLKSKVKESFPEITFFKVDQDIPDKPGRFDELDESVHGKPPRKKREKKVVKDVFADPNLHLSETPIR